MRTTTVRSTSLRGNRSLHRLLDRRGVRDHVNTNDNQKQIYQSRFMARSIV